MVRKNKSKFIKIVSENSLSNQDKLVSTNKKKLTELRKRYNELDNVIRKIYEDNIAGKLTDKRFEKLSADYEKEQEEIEQNISRIESEIETIEKQAINTEKFIELVDRYTDFKELTTPMLNEFIEKIVVHERIKGYRYTSSQKIDIYFNFIGKIELPNNIEVDVNSTDFEPKKISANSKIKYKKIIDYFESADNRLELSFGDFENILGFKLTETNLTSTHAWYPSSNRPLSNVIYNAGYDIKKIDVKNGLVILERP